MINVNEKNVFLVCMDNKNGGCASLSAEKCGDVAWVGDARFLRLYKRRP